MFDTALSKMRLKYLTESVAHLQQWALSTLKHKNSQTICTRSYFKKYRILMLQMCNTGLNRGKINLLEKLQI